MLQSIVSAFQLAARAVRRNKLRALLTILGILIGVAAVVLVSALGSGAREDINQKVSSLGSNVLVVFFQPNQASGARKSQGSSLTEDDGRALVRESTSIAKVAPVLRAGSQLVYETRNWSTQVFGSTSDYFQVRAWNVVRGELWPDTPRDFSEKVAVIGASVATELFGSLDPIGRTIRIGRYPFRVIGVLEKKGQSPFMGQDQDDLVVIPLASFRKNISANNLVGSVDQLLVSATSEETVSRAEVQVDAILRQRHHIQDNSDPDFVIRTQSDLRETQDSIYAALSTLLLSVGLVSLGVGGIGIMNIMLVSVAERTREIGIRMAIGAKEGDILVQFLVEAVILAMIGGLGGTVLGVIAIAILRRVLEWPMTVQPGPLIVALATSMIIGVVFGFFPARRAARMDPIQALGRE
ncbi:MAG: ABC transporter permease [Deltaproteobacteria bacterium]|nr:ABC transporter permease [Deltaproteobacteria bacterium]